MDASCSGEKKNMSKIEVKRIFKVVKLTKPNQSQDHFLVTKFAHKTTDSQDFYVWHSSKRQQAHAFGLAKNDWHAAV